MNKQEFQQKIKDMKPPRFFNAVTLREAYEAGFEEAKGNALCDSCFLNEPEKPVVPQFVADWYEEIKDNFDFNLYKLCIKFYEKKLSAGLYAWFNENNNKCIETLVKMKLFGYEIEKEKLYTVELPNPNCFGLYYVILRRDNKGKIYISSSVFDREIWRGEENAQLTESEIKQDFEWALQFKEEVKEC